MDNEEVKKTQTGNPEVTESEQADVIKEETVAKEAEPLTKESTKTAKSEKQPKKWWSKKSANEKANKKKKPLAREILEWICSLGVAFAIVFLLKGFVFDIVKVDGDSMYPTLHNNDRLIVTKLGYTPQQGDIVILDCHYDARQAYYAQKAAEQDKGELNWFDKFFANFSLPDNVKKVYYVKRVIATEGQTVDINNGKVYVDGEEYIEEYINEPTMKTDTAIEYPVTVEEGHIFVMGDNRDNSLDSRSSRLGQVDNNAVLGKAQLRIYPFNSFGGVR